MKRKRCCALLLAFVMLFQTGCSALLSDTAMPEDTVEEFEDAVNNMDVNAMMDCMDEDAVKAVTAGLDIALGVAGAVTGVKLGISGETLLNAFPLFQGISGELMRENGYPEVDFQVTKTLIKGSKATVYFTEVNSGKNTMINMKKQDGKWVFVLDTVPLTEEEADRVIVAGEEETDEEETSETESEDAGSGSSGLTDSAKLAGKSVGDILQQLFGGSDTSDSSDEDEEKPWFSIEDTILSLFGKKGWETETIDGVECKVYYENGKKVTSDWRNLEGQWYYFQEDGSLCTNGFYTIDGNLYHFNQEYADRGWVTLDDTWYYFDESDCHALTGCQNGIAGDGNLYFFWQDGYTRKDGSTGQTGALAAATGLYQDGQLRYYADAYGHLLTNQAEVSVEGGIYSFDAQGNATNLFDPVWPCENSYTITTLYRYSETGDFKGARHSTHFQYGIDISAPNGTNVLATEKGTVILSEYSTSSGFGNWIKILHKNGKVSLYAHLSERLVNVGDQVEKGQIIAKSGNTSAKYTDLGYHLHFELGNEDVYQAAGDPYEEYFKTKYADLLNVQCRTDK